MRVLAIDPGPKQSAFVVWDGKQIIDCDKCDNIQIFDAIALTEYDIYICEMVACYGMAVGKEVFETVFWSGRFFERASIAMKVKELIYRKDVKMHFCNTMRAKDANISRELKDRFGENSTKAKYNPVYGDFKLKEDIWQAFALAVYYYDTRLK